MKNHGMSHASYLRQMAEDFPHELGIQRLQEIAVALEELIGASFFAYEALEEGDWSETRERLREARLRAMGPR